MQRNLSFRELTYWKRKGYVYKRSLDTNDCGPACLAAILEYYGLKVTVTQIANDARTDANGTTLLGMIKAAEHYGMTAYAYQVNVDGKIEEVYALLSSGCPFIAHLLLENGVRHFITVYELTDSEIIFSEPSKGPRKCSKEDFMKQFTGNVIILKPGENFEARELDRPKPLIFKVIQREKKKTTLCCTIFSCGKHNWGCEFVLYQVFG
jgi:ATP-binding cassette subfamily B protein